jgi:hypothetical protein
MKRRFQMQGGKNWILPKLINAHRFIWDSHWLEIWSMGPNGGSVAMDSVEHCSQGSKCKGYLPIERPPERPVFVLLEFKPFPTNSTPAPLVSGVGDLSRIVARVRKGYLE